VSFGMQDKEDVWQRPRPRKTNTARAVRPLQGAQRKKNRNRFWQWGGRKPEKKKGKGRFEVIFTSPACLTKQEGASGEKSRTKKRRVQDQTQKKKKKEHTDAVAV